MLIYEFEYGNFDGLGASRMFVLTLAPRGHQLILQGDKNYRSMPSSIGIGSHFKETYDRLQIIYFSKIFTNNA